MDVFFSQEISDFDKRTILLHYSIDREASTHRPHLVTEAQCDTRDLDQYLTAESVKGRHLLPYFPTSCQPRAASFLSKETECYPDVSEVPPWVPLGPFTITECPFRAMLTFSGMSTA